VIDPTCAATPACATSTSLVTSCLQDAAGCTYPATPIVCTGDDVCERVAPACADSYWVEWPLPPDLNPTNYKDNGDGTVTDTLTGLMWQQATPVLVMDWATAKSYCATTLRQGGHADWRLPAKIELLSLADYGMPYPGPAINTTYFPGTQANFYWTSTPLAGSSDNAWNINFNAGWANPNDLLSKNYVRCVR
jgi:hypothetical protein